MSLVTTNDVLRPTLLSDYLGQERVKTRLRPWIAEARETTEPMVHTLITSDPGMGKTTLAQVIANELDDPFEVVDLARMTDKQFVDFVRRFEGGVLFADEIHRAKPAQQENLLTLMEEGYVATSYGGRVYAEFLCVIAATTEPHKLVDAVKERFTLHLELEPYADEEMVQIVASMAHHLELSISEEDIVSLAKAAGGVPRWARKMVRSWKALGHDGTPSVEAVLDMTGRESDGLSHKHLDYLRVLNNLEGQAGERSICNHLRIHPSEMAVLERLLVERNLISLAGSAGRVITQAGDARLRGRTHRTRRRREPAWHHD